MLSLKVHDDLCGDDPYSPNISTTPCLLLSFHPLWAPQASFLHFRWARNFLIINVIGAMSLTSRCSSPGVLRGSYSLLIFTQATSSPWAPYYISKIQLSSFPILFSFIYNHHSLYHRFCLFLLLIVVAFCLFVLFSLTGTIALPAREFCPFCSFLLKIVCCYNRILQTK